jgi:hypothetical protein
VLIPCSLRRALASALVVGAGLAPISLVACGADAPCSEPGYAGATWEAALTGGRMHGADQDVTKDCSARALDGQVEVRCAIGQLGPMYRADIALPDLRTLGVGTTTLARSRACEGTARVIVHGATGGAANDTRTVTSDYRRVFTVEWSDATVVAGNSCDASPAGTWSFSLDFVVTADDFNPVYLSVC